MCKKALSVIVLLSGSAWVQAQQALPGMAVLSADKASARSEVTVAAASPPEPGALGGNGLPMGLSGLGQPAPMGPGAYPPGLGMMPPGMGGPGMMPPGMGMGGPGMMPPGMGGPGMMPPGAEGPSLGSVPPGPDGYVPGSIGGYGPVGPTSTFGSEQFWFNIGYAAGWLTKPRLTLPLVTESTNTAIAQPGAIGQPGTMTAFGDANYKYGTYQGLTFDLGVNLTNELSLEINSQIYPSQHVSWTTSSDGNGNPIVARPVIAAGVPSSFVSSFPGTFLGSTAVNGTSELWGIELAGRYTFAITPYLTGDFLLGYRRMELVENLNIYDAVTPIIPSVSFLGNQFTPGPGNYITDTDHFGTNNTFNGVDFGGRLRWQSGFDWFAMSGYWKEAIGATSQNVNIYGSTTLNSSGNPPATVPGGVLALPSNMGSYNRTVFGSITEGGFAFILTPCKYVRFEVGYSATYWNSVVRPGQQINYNVVSSQIPSTNPPYTGGIAGAQPLFTYHSQGLTIQTLNVGVSLYY